MFWTIHCLDGADVTEQRKALGAEHSAHLKTARPAPLVYGPLLADDGESGVGSLFIIDAPDRAAAERWVEADPFRRGGVWQEVRIHLFRQSANAPVQLPQSPAV
ncbi:YciI family protein [Kitasatospora sp. NBC_01287]|uniref:YciI family protein n=1 Tax=Kitasatospora sp. NBC_01287 TaxID=2903573 RepID=UPI0022581BA1|nr:YciI family protein [Kitasatospora sp. NBC_01287]MCX4746049.1 YciI family protein [Kitasatospora sp. NBC_01287]